MERRDVEEKEKALKEQLKEFNFKTILISDTWLFKYFHCTLNARY